MVQRVDRLAEIVRFSVFELDRRSGELRKAGVRIALQNHSLTVLERLLERRGEVVTRDELRQLLWPAETFVDFERGLNTVVTRLRNALGDAADTPRFIETLPRRGYRFIAPVERLDGSVERRSTAIAGPQSRRIPPAVLLALTTAVVGLIVAVVLIAARRPAADPATAPMTYLLASVLPADQLLSAEVADRDPTIGFGRPSRTAIALSPDGRQLVFSARRGESQMLYLRPLDRPDAVPLAGTEGGDSPFFSPDGKWIGFWADGRIRKIAATGGPAITVADLAPPPRAPTVVGPTDPPLFGASWGSDDVIVFSLGRGGLWEVPATGGTPAALTTLQQDEVSHRLPHVLPGATALVFTAMPRVLGHWERASVDSYVRATGERKLIAEGAADARYLPTGHLLYVRNGTLLAAPFDAARLELTGPPVGMVGDVMQAAFGKSTRVDTGAAQFAVSNTGTLVYVPGGVYPKASGKLVWVDRRGRIEPLGTEAGVIGETPRLSPDGRRVVLIDACQNPTQACRDVWTYDLERSRLARLTFGAGAFFPVWRHDARGVVFASDMRGPMGLFQVPADGSEPAAPLTNFEGHVAPADWSPAGDALVFARRAGDRSWDIWALVPGNGMAQARAVVRSDFDEIHPALSPNGRWLAYVSTESGTREVYVQPFPGPGPKEQISTGGGSDPLWARDGRELFFLGGQPPRIRMMAVSIRTEPELAVGRSTILFDIGRHVGRVFEFYAPGRGYDVSADGRFLMKLMDEPPPPVPVTQLHVILNWHEELKAKVGR